LQERICLLEGENKTFRSVEELLGGRSMKQVIQETHALNARMQELETQLAANARTKARTKALTCARLPARTHARTHESIRSFAHT
jgi:hypothetical protein